MSSVTPDKKTGVSPASSEVSGTDSKSIIKLSCPFTWGIKKKLRNYENPVEEIIANQDHFPEFILIYHLMLAYENVLNENLQIAIKCIKDGEDSLHEIKQRGTLESVERVLQHILFGTMYHVLQQLGQPTQADQLLKEICNVEDMNETELAMLSGCQCWYKNEGTTGPTCCLVTKFRKAKFSSAEFTALLI